MRATNKNNILPISIGLVYLWFGMLKFFPDLSPAEGLAKNTIHALTLGIIPDDVSIMLLALWETLIGIFLIAGLFRRTAIILALVHMVCTFAPLVLFPEETFNQGPFYLTLLGQYIMKNLVIIAALVILYNEETSRAKSYAAKRGQVTGLLGIKLNLQRFLQKS
ncbi:DoxX family protein [Flagellimonas meishanensis]|uniref:DoxX family protein n=1 Tax=Flagellimonas meishanensis TaxID=2873264 RepID=UPI001CA716F9|nr:DoxX family protein [[Muricauda] meishanensis]